MTDPTRPFSINVFFPSGLRTGIKQAGIPNWVGKCTFFPRSSLKQVRESKELDQPGVYILTGTESASTLPIAYIGEGDPIAGRILSHESNKDWWDNCIAVTCNNKGLSKAHIKFIESALYESALNESRCTLDNKLKPGKPNLSPIEKSFAQDFLDFTLLCMQPLGLDIFPRTALRDNNVSTVGGKLYLKSRGLIAEAYDSSDGFIVIKGSHSSTTESEGLDSVDRARRADLIKLGVLVNKGKRFIFTKDYRFTSPTLAARAILGAPAPGPLRWKNNSGLTLRAIRDSLTG
jgi:hypothetical protein